MSRASTSRVLTSLLIADGVAATGLTAVGIALARPGLALLGAVALASWAIAVAGVPVAVRHRQPRGVDLARMRVVAGMAINAVGSVMILVQCPSTAIAAGAVLAMGTALSVAYLALLSRLAVSDPVGHAVT